MTPPPGRTRRDGAQGGGIRERAEIVVAHGHVGDDRRAPLRPPFGHISGEAARPVLVGAAEIDRVAGPEILLAVLDGGDEPMTAEAPARSGRSSVSRSPNVLFSGAPASRLRLALSR